MQRGAALSRLKCLIVPAGPVPRWVPFGLFRGLRLEIDLTSQTQLYLGLWERETYPFLRRALATADWLVDVGAGSGELVLAFLRRRPAGHAWAIEPNALARKALERNLDLNPHLDRRRVTLVEKLAGHRNEGEMVRLDTLPVPWDRPGLIKIDVDGAELEVLHGAAGLLMRPNVPVLVETHAAELEQAAITFLGDCGCQYQIIPNAWWRAIIPENRPISHNRWLAAWRAD